MINFSNSLVILGITASLLLSAQQASSADFRFPVESAPESINNPVELGSGWYLRGDLGWSNNKGPQLAPEAAKDRHLNWAVDVGAGFKFNDWLRSDLTIGWNKPRDYTTTGFRVTCPYMLNGLTDQTSNLKTGYLWDSTHDTCDPVTKAQLNKIDLMWNAYLDLGSWRGFSPFVGAGAGVSVLRANTTLKYLKTSNGSEYAADLTPTDTYPHIWTDEFGNTITSWTDGAGVPHAGQPPIGFDKQVWTRQTNKTSFNLAWSLMGGLAYDITPQLKGELSYRYLNSGSFSSLSSPLIGTVKSSIDSHQVRLGFRYMMD